MTPRTEAELERYLDHLLSDQVDLKPWIRKIYPLLWREYEGFMDSEGQPTEREDFAFTLLQHLHQ